MYIDYDQIDYNDPKTWDLICNGYTKGCFQIQSFLGRSWCKKIKPHNIEELSALIALIRPGCLEVIIDGKSVPQHYADRKNGIEPVEYFHLSLESILKNTYGLLIYQEQSIKIAQKLGGFNASEADILRKNIGKKDAIGMAATEKQFLVGAEKTGIVNQEEAKEIFSWIKKSQRYQFNASHSISYSINAYVSAYYKANNTLQFFRSFLNYAPEEPKSFEKISELVDDSKIFDIYIRTPDIRLGNIDFQEIPEKNEIICGLKCIRGVGESTIVKINDLLKSREVGAIGLNEWVFDIWPKIKSDAVISLISVGAFDFLNKPRKALIYLFQNTAKLTKNERAWIKEHGHKYATILPLLTDLSKTKKEGGGCHDARGSKKLLEIINNLKKPPFPLKDDVEWLVKTEKHLLGFSSMSRISVVDDYQSTSSCIDLLQNRVNNACVAVEIRDVRERTIKTGPNAGKTMAGLVIQDDSCVLDNVVIFSENFEAYQSLLEPNNCVRMVVYKPKDKDSIIVNKVEQL